MTDRRRGPYALLESARIYTLFNRAIGGMRLREWLVQNLGIEPGMSILDVGSGTSSINAVMTGVDYTGIEPNKGYVEEAQNRFPAAKILQGGIEDLGSLEDAYDVVMALGVLHHVDDTQVSRFFRGAARCLTPRGRIVTLDPGTWSGLTRVAKFNVGLDRGGHVRNVGAMTELISQSAGKLNLHTEIVPLSGRLRVPFGHILTTSWFNT